MYLLAIVASVVPLYILMRVAMALQDEKSTIVKLVAQVTGLAAIVSVIALFVAASKLDGLMATMLPGGAPASSEFDSYVSPSDTSVIAGTDTLPTPYVVPMPE